jgi:CubicO group peptidase (beta-lactamase class C family)
VFRGGKIVYKQGYGLANLEHNIPILPNSVFNIGSTAKQFTAFGIAYLESQGSLGIDDDIRDYLPEMQNFGSVITISNLLYHTSGIRCTFPDLLGLAEYWESDLVTQDDVFRLLRKQRELDFPPGTEFGYANSNYILLAVICERVSGHPFGQFCQELIFNPLSMVNTTVMDDPMRILPGRVDAYYEQEDGGWIRSVLVDSVMGPTNIYSTIEDLAFWDENFYTARVGGKEVIERVHTPGKLMDGTTLDYAFGFEVGPAHQHLGWQMVEHGGGHGGYCNHMLRFPDLHLSVVVMFNHFLWNSREYALKVADLFIDDIPGFVSNTGSTTRSCPTEGLDPGQLKGLSGVYFNPDRAALRTVSFEKGSLHFDGLKLRLINEMRFYFDEEPGVEVEFSTDENGKPANVTTYTSTGEYSYDIVEVEIPGTDILNEFQGRYYSPELDVYWNIEIDGNQLVVHRRKYPDTWLTPLFKDVLSDDWFSITGYPKTLLLAFTRDEQGKINGLKVSGERIRNLRFIKELHFTCYL